MNIIKALVLTMWVLPSLTNNSLAKTSDRQEYEVKRSFSKSTTRSINSLTQKALEKRPSGQSERIHTKLGIFISITPKETWKSKSGHFCRSYIQHTVDLNNKQKIKNLIACRNTKGHWQKAGAN